MLHRTLASMIWRRVTLSHACSVRACQARWRVKPHGCICKTQESGSSAHVLCYLCAVVMLTPVEQQNAMPVSGPEADCHASHHNGMSPAVRFLPNTECFLGSVHIVQDAVHLSTMFLAQGRGLKALPGQAHPLAVVTPLVGRSTFSTLPGVTAANINDNVTCVEPSSRLQT